MQRTEFAPNNILVEDSAVLMDCDNPGYSATTNYTIDAPSLPFDITCDSTTYTVWTHAVFKY